MWVTEKLWGGVSCPLHISLPITWYQCPMLIPEPFVPGLPQATPSLPSSLDDEAGVKNGDKATEVSSAGPATADADAASESSEEESNESEDSEEESEESEASSSSEEEDDDDDDAETTSEGGVPPPSSEVIARGGVDGCEFRRPGWVPRGHAQHSALGWPMKAVCNRCNR